MNKKRHLAALSILKILKHTFFYFIFINFPLQDSTSCQLHWDSLLCWPETSINNTLYLPCPNYVNKFNVLSNKFLKIFFTKNLSLNASKNHLN